MHKKQLADEIEKEGIERVVYGKDLTTMRWINETLLEALRSTPPEARRKLPGLPMEIQEWCWHMDQSLEQDNRHAAMALRAAWPAVSNWLQHNVGPTVADPKDQTFPSPLAPSTQEKP